MAIKKGTFSFTFLFDDEVNPVDDVMGMPVDEIMTQCDMGEMIGNLDLSLQIVDVPEIDVKYALLALGNDGTFFDSE